MSEQMSELMSEPLSESEVRVRTYVRVRGFGMWHGPCPNLSWEMFITSAPYFFGLGTYLAWLTLYGGNSIFLLSLQYFIFKGGLQCFKLLNSKTFLFQLSNRRFWRKRFFTLFALGVARLIFCLPILELLVNIRNYLEKNYQSFNWS